MNECQPLCDAIYGFGKLTAGASRLWTSDALFIVYHLIAKLDTSFGYLKGTHLTIFGLLG